MDRVEFSVKGMTCDNCVNSVTQALKQVDGVKATQVTLAEEKARVTFDSNVTTADQIKEAVRQAGYEVA